MQQARDLMDEERYNEAVVVLQQVISTHPERIDEAEALLRRIRAVRTDYNRLFDRLLDHLDESPEDLETTLSIIDEMESLESHPSPQIREQIRTARFVAQLAYDRELVRRILVDAVALLEEQRYGDALERYREGFELRRDNFEERGYDAEFVAQISSLRSGLITWTDAVISSVDAVLTAVGQAERYPDTRSAQTLEQASSGLMAALEEIVVLEQELGAAASEAMAARERVADEFPDEPVDWHVTFLRVLSVGSIRERRYQGVLGATALLLDQAVARFRAPLQVVGRDRIEAGVLRVEEERYFDALRLFTDAEQDFEAVVTAVLQRSGPDLDEAGPEVLEPAEGEETEDLHPHDALIDQLERVARGMAPVYLETQLQREQAHAYAEVAQTLSASEIPVAVEPAIAPDEREVYNETRSALLVSYEDLSEGRVSTSERLDLWQRRAGLLETSLQDTRTALSESVVAETLDQLTAYRETLLQREGEAFVQLAEYQYSDASRGFDEIVENVERAERYLTGRERPPGAQPPEPVSAAELGQDPPPIDDPAPEALPDLVPSVDAPLIAEEVPVLQYPVEARELIIPLIPQLAELAPRVRGYAELVGASDDQVRQEPLVELWIERTVAFAGLFDDVSARMAEILDTSDMFLARAEELRAEGEELLAQTEQAIAALEVETARELWEEARSKLYESLELKDDPEFRSEIDERIVALGLEIQEAQNQRIVQEVRERIRIANEYYTNEEYIPAQGELLEARRLWEQTNVTENTEIERLLGLVNAALNFEDERVLTEADPLYPVLANYLNIAQEDFERGRQLQQNASPEQAEDYLDRAERNLENVVAVRPNNWEARLLQLRIIELREGDNFMQVFERRLEDVLDERDTTDTITTLTELEVLREINPDYPGLQDLIVELEIEAGLRPDPVTVAQEQESNQLLAQAQGIAGGGLGQDRAAMQLLEQALNLNPNNREAQALLDQIRIRTGGQATVALSTTAEQRYRRAEALFIQGSVAQAYSIVQNLMQDEANAGYPPLQQLHRRITSRLGI